MASRCSISNGNIVVNLNANCSVYYAIFDLSMNEDPNNFAYNYNEGTWALRAVDIQMSGAMEDFREITLYVRNTLGSYDRDSVNYRFLGIRDLVDGNGAVQYANWLNKTEDQIIKLTGRY
jgi:hypothetical protein